MMRPRSSTAHWPWLLLVALVALLYLFGLGSSYAPTNGDEMVYIHIARMTAESGHWLPLQSELVGTRNTKPLAGHGGRWLGPNLESVRTALSKHHLHLRHHRLAGVFCLSHERGFQAPAHCLRGGCLVSAVFLHLPLRAGVPHFRTRNLLCTFRYGRVYLTSAPETFWLALPMWWVLWLRLRGSTTGMGHPADATPGPLAYTLFGIAMGLGAAYKSFALVAPAAAALWCAVLLSTPWSWRTAIRTTIGTGWSTLIGVGIFAL
ncbi:MAG: hypothetical protein EBR58_13230, partial [Betaproteobacteria bacterium]|nr:hypothetical protein [Betaproteobacteria bacterium]